MQKNELQDLTFISLKDLFLIPNLITSFRIILAFFFPILIHYDYLNWAFFLILIFSFLDFLDGYLSRRLKQVSALGTLLDPLADKLGFFILFFSFLFYFSLNPFILAFFIFIFIKDFLQILLALYCFLKGFPAISANKNGKQASFFLSIFAFLLFLKLTFFKDIEGLYGSIYSLLLFGLAMTYFLNIFKALKLYFYRFTSSKKK